MPHFRCNTLSLFFGHSLSLDALKVILGVMNHEDKGMSTRYLLISLYSQIVLRELLFSGMFSTRPTSI